MNKVELITYIAYSLPAVVIAFFWLKASKKSTTNKENYKITVKDGLTEPASLHPIINEGLCVGCGACVRACPEGEIIGLIKGKAQLLKPTKCIGHGACKAACPFDAITLVFGTEKRGIDIPNVSENFETNVPGLFIAGELGGMGLIRNAITQGKQAMDAMRKHDFIKNGDADAYDVAIIGVGPAGLAATLSAKENKLKYITLEQDSLGGTVFNFPRGKVVMTAPIVLPIFGKVNFKETTKEKLLTLWQEVEKKSGIKINYKEKMENIEPTGNGFKLTSSKGEYKVKTILLSIGRRGTPRKLGVDGEELPKVVYNLIDPAQYKNKNVLVVGGGDSALEAATSIAEEDGATVSISYRSESFSRAKEKNRKKILDAESAGNMQVLLSSNVKNITKTGVELDQNGEKINLKNDAILVCAGGILPTPFLKEIGITVETKHGTV